MLLTFNAIVNLVVADISGLAAVFFDLISFSGNVSSLSDFIISPDFWNRKICDGSFLDIVNIKYS